MASPPGEHDRISRALQIDGVGVGAADYRLAGAMPGIVAQGPRERDVGACRVHELVCVKFLAAGNQVEHPAFHMRIFPLFRRRLPEGMVEDCDSPEPADEVELRLRHGDIAAHNRRNVRRKGFLNLGYEGVEFPAVLFDVFRQALRASEILNVRVRIMAFFGVEKRHRRRKAREFALHVLGSGIDAVVGYCLVVEPDFVAAQGDFLRRVFPVRICGVYVAVTFERPKRVDVLPKRVDGDGSDEAFVPAALFILNDESIAALFFKVGVNGKRPVFFAIFCGEIPRPRERVRLSVPRCVAVEY